MKKVYLPSKVKWQTSMYMICTLIEILDIDVSKCYMHFVTVSMDITELIDTAMVYVEKLGVLGLYVDGVEKNFVVKAKIYKYWVSLLLKWQCLLVISQ